MPDLNLQVPGNQPLAPTANPDLWESELLDEQRRADPGFLRLLQIDPSSIQWNPA